MSDSVIGLFALYIIIVSSSVSVLNMGKSKGGLFGLIGGLLNTITGGGGFGGGFVKGVTDPVGATNDLVDAAQGKTGLSEASSEQECQIKCGDAASCSMGKRDAAAGKIPAGREDMWAWCSGNPTSTMKTTSKDKFGTACCT